MLPRLLLLLLCWFVGRTVIAEGAAPVVTSPTQNAPSSVSGGGATSNNEVRVLPALAANATVFAAQSNYAVDEYRENPAIVRRMVDDLVMRMTQQPNILTAWRSLVKPTDRVGVKITTKGGPLFSTHAGVIDAVLTGLQSAGVPRDRIVLWDGIHSVQDIDPKATFSAATLGKLIWGDLKFREKSEDLSSLSYMSRVLTSGLTKIINLPVLCASEGNGVAGALYNLTIPNIDNWRRLTIEPGSGDPGIADLYADPNIGPKVVLTILDGLTAQFAAGPSFQPNYTFVHGTLYAGKDAVAIDTIALARINEWRQMARLPPVTSQASYLRTAGQMGLGVCEPERIRVIPVP